MSKPITNQHALHPGRLLEREMEYLKISVKKLAMQMDIPVESLNEVIQQKKRMTIEMANSIEKILDIPASYFTNCQKDYDRIMSAEKKKQHAKKTIPAT
jgi:addiction module HigA family antidote